MVFQKMHLVIKIHKTTYTICETNKCIETVLFCIETDYYRPTRSVYCNFVSIKIILVQVIHNMLRKQLTYLQA